MQYIIVKLINHNKKTLLTRTGRNEDINEGHAGLLGQVLVVDDLLQQRLL